MTRPVTKQHKKWQRDRVSKVSLIHTSKHIKVPITKVKTKPIIMLYIYIYIYKTETFETPTIFHVSII